MAAAKGVNDRVLRLNTYVEKLKQTIAGEKDAEKKAFFERDLKKTLATIEKLR